MRMDNETKYFIQDEVRRQLSEAVNEMRKALAKKIAHRSPWWKRASNWVRGYFYGLLLDFKRQQWARLSTDERIRREDLWLSSTLPKLRGKRPTPHRGSELGDEKREVVLETDFVKHILEQPEKAN